MSKRQPFEIRFSLTLKKNYHSSENFLPSSLEISLAKGLSGASTVVVLAISFENGGRKFLPSTAVRSILPKEKMSLCVLSFLQAFTSGAR